MELQETQNDHNNLEKEKQNWRTHTSQFQNLLQSYRATAIKTVENWTKDKQRSVG